MRLTTDAVTFNKQPMLLLSTAFGFGVLIGNFFYVPASASAWIALAFAIVAAVFSSRGLATLLIVIAFAAVGALCLTIDRMPPAKNRVKAIYDSGEISSTDPVEVEGELTAPPERAADGQFIELIADRITAHNDTRNVTGRVRLLVPLTDTPLALHYGTRVRVFCTLSREDRYLDPGVIPVKETLDREGVDATGSVKSARLIEKISDESVIIPLAWVYDERARLVEDIRLHMSPRAAGVLIAATLGDRYLLDKETADAFRDGGTFHFLVIAGLHTTFIGGLFLFILRRFTKARWIHFVATTGFLWAYTLAVGADVPVVRAATMFTFLLLSYVVYRPATLLNAYGTCALILLIWRPHDLFDTSFQLTFVAVGAIVGIAFPLIERLRAVGSWSPNATNPFPPTLPSGIKRICETLFWDDEAWAIESKRQIWSGRLFKHPFAEGTIKRSSQKMLRWLAEGLIVSAIVQLTMLPLSIVYFHRVSLSGILLNLWVGPLIAAESLSALIGIAISQISSILATPFFDLAELFNWAMTLLPRLFSDNGWTSFRLPAYVGRTSLIYILYFIPILVLGLILNRWSPFDIRSCGSRWKLVVYSAAFAIAALSVVFIAHPLSAPTPDGRLYVDFLDVGQGDSALVTFPDGTTLLVDGGGRAGAGMDQDEDDESFHPDQRRIGESVVSEFLWYRGYSHIDYILPTHGDADHIEGLADVAKNFSIGSALLARRPLHNTNFLELERVLNRRGFREELIGKGMRFAFGGVLVDVLNPEISDNTEEPWDNNRSLVLRLSYGSRSFLLTGDMERPTEAVLTTDGGSLASDVIKVPHHGSRTSSSDDLVNAVRPQYAIISVGRTSPFGHPHKEVVNRWLLSGSTVLTTGSKGTISASTNGVDLAVTTFEP